MYSKIGQIVLKIGQIVLEIGQIVLDKNQIVLQAVHKLVSVLEIIQIVLKNRPDRTQNRLDCT